MPRDFVQNKRATRNKKSKTKSGGMSRARTLVTLIIIVIFIGLLIFLQGKRNAQPSSTDGTKVQVPKTPPSQDNTVPKPTTTANKQPVTSATPSSAPVFDFYNLLPDAKVEAPQQEVYQSTPKELAEETLFWLQTDSFRQSLDAENRRAQLILFNISNVSVKKSDNNNGTWYQVRVGPYSSRAQLAEVKNQLVAHNINYIEIKQTP